MPISPTGHPTPKHPTKKRAIRRLSSGPTHSRDLVFQGRVGRSSSRAGALAIAEKELVVENDRERSGRQRACATSVLVIYVYCDRQTMLAAAEDDAAQRADVAEVAAPRYGHVPFAGEDGVRGVEVDPAERG